MTSPTDDPYKHYYSAAYAAMLFARSKMNVGEDDKFLNMLVELGWPKLYVGEVYRQEDELLKAMNVPTGGNWDKYGMQYIEAMVLAALNMGAGNCGEQAALAFMHLYVNKIRPIDYMQMLIPGFLKDTRNAFVVVGAPVRPTRDNFDEWSIAPSMLCDPWIPKVTRAVNIRLKHPPKSIFSAFRVE